MPRRSLLFALTVVGTLALTLWLSVLLAQPLAGAPRWLNALLQLALFAPLFFITALLYRQHRPRRAELMPELTGVLGVAVTLIDGYLIALALKALGWFPVRETFSAPAHWRDWAALLLIYGAMIFFGRSAFRRGGWAQLAEALIIPHRRVTLLLLLSALTLAAWAVDGFAAVSALAVPAYAWLWIEPRHSVMGKLLNSALALVGLAPALLNLSTQAIGPLAWYLPIGAVYALFPLSSILAFILLISLGVRFAVYGWREA